MRFKALLLAAALATALPLTVQAKTFRWSRSVDISTWDIHTQNVGVNNTMHGAVCLFIAGSYTVFASGHLGGPGAGAMLVVVWLVACAGVALKALGRLSSPWWSTGGYLAMGWLVLLAALPVVERAPAAGVQWLVAGGCAYTFGVVFFVLDARIRYAHAVWHGFVAAGTACHTWAVLG